MLPLLCFFVFRNVELIKFCLMSRVAYHVGDRVRLKHVLKLLSNGSNEHVRMSVVCVRCGVRAFVVYVCGVSHVRVLVLRRHGMHVRVHMLVVCVRLRGACACGVCSV